MPDGFATACQIVHTVTCPHGTFSLADRCPVCWPRLAVPAPLDADEAEWIALTDDGADEWTAHDGVPLNLWREYCAAANAGAFDFCAAEEIAERRRRRELLEEGGAR